MLVRQRGFAGTIAVMLFVAMPGGCGSDGGVEPIRPPEVDGTWQWVHAVSLSTGEAMTPASTGYSAQLELHAGGDDRSQGDFEYREDEAVVVTGGFETGFESGHGVNYISWDPTPVDFHDTVQAYVILVGDTLLLMDDTGPRYESRWAKVK